MICPKCRCENVSVTVVTETQLKRKHHNIIWWLLVGWWLEPLLWIFLTVPKLLFTLFLPKRQKLVTKQRTVCICQNCGHTWNK